MSPPIRRFLTEGAEVLHKDSNSMEKLMIYLEQSLETLYKTLNEVNFNRMPEIEGSYTFVAKIVNVSNKNNFI